MYQFVAMQLSTIAAHAEGPTEADWIRWAGVVLAFTGTLAAAPKGVIHLIKSASSAFWAAVVWVLARTMILKLTVMILASVMAVVAWMRNPPVKHADVGSPPEDQSSTNVQISWDQSEPQEAKVERLHSILVQVIEHISIVQRAAESRDAELNQAIRRLGDTMTALEKRMTAADVGAAKADARGVILIGLGVILTGIPDELAQVAWIGWLVFAIALLLFSGVTLALAQERRTAARAHRITQPPAAPNAPRPANAALRWPPGPG